MTFLADALIAINRQGAKDSAISRQRDTVNRDMAESIYHLLDVRLNRSFAAKSALMMYHDANWVPERIPDEEIRISSMLYGVRLVRIEQVIDPATGEKKLKETNLVKR
jgi:hypothetical protein